METIHDIIIVGAGPSGAGCAAFLAREGIPSLVLERGRFPRDKTCGDGVSAKACALLGELGIRLGRGDATGFRILGTTFHGPGGVRVEIPVADLGERASGICVQRRRLDALILESARGGAEVREAVAVRRVVRRGDGIFRLEAVSMDSGEPMAFLARVVVGADGAASAVGRSLAPDTGRGADSVGARAYYRGIQGLGRHLELYFLPGLIPGYFWIFPLEGGLANVGIGLPTGLMKRRQLRFPGEIPALISRHARLRDRFKNAEVVEGSLRAAAVPTWSGNGKRCGEGWLLLGDGARLVDPFSGEGIANALHSGKIAAQVIRQAFSRGGGASPDLSAYDRILREQMGRDLRSSRRMHWFFRSPARVAFMMRRLERSAWLREALSETLLDERSRRRVTGLLFLIQALFRA